ncbi:MAG: alpha/beta hydrolase [Solirubrobacterales bacterium]|nr:alpha/beta hydrolase [Solirubrobacterales bacterium]
MTTTTTTTDRRRWRDPALGPARTLDLRHGRIAYHDVGEGPAIVFVHGFLVNANLWRKVVARLAPEHRCVTLDLPLGAHNLPLAPGTAVDPPAMAELVADALEALGLEDATVVGNDTGGALCQMLVTTRPERVGRLVLTSCDFRDDFPPKLFRYLELIARVPPLMGLMLQSMRLGPMLRSPLAFGWLTTRPIDRAAQDSYVYPAIEDRAVRDDARRLILGLDPAQTRRAADLLGGFDRPALIAWSAEDRVFPVAHAHELAAVLPNSRLELIEGARTFSMEDEPARLAELIERFVREPAAAP